MRPFPASLLARLLAMVWALRRKTGGPFVQAGLDLVLPLFTPWHLNGCFLGGVHISVLVNAAAEATAEKAPLGRDRPIANLGEVLAAR